jgi:hypothetical protein
MVFPAMPVESYPEVGISNPINCVVLEIPLESLSFVVS